VAGFAWGCRAGLDELVDQRTSPQHGGEVGTVLFVQAARLSSISSR
jgi:hypothetical protein